MSDDPVRQEVTVRFPKLRFTLDVEQIPEKPEGAPVTAVLTIGGNLMPAQISIDDNSQAAQLFWVDDKGDTDAAPPDGAQVQFSVDDPAVATVDAASGQLTPVAEGSGNVTVTITGPDGGPLLEPDGTTPFAAEPAGFQVVAGEAVGVGLKIQSATPPAPATP